MLDELYESEAWERFLKTDFPAYATFWQTQVAPLTNRPDNVHFKTDAELQEIGKGPKDICIAQLCYTMLRHLIRCHKMKDTCDNMEAFTEAMMRLSAALDCAFELLERFEDKHNHYAAWSEDRKIVPQGGKQAREKWQNRQRQDNKEMWAQISPVRQYRNHLVHGRLSVVMKDKLVPKICQEQNYLDWRKVTQGASASVKQDFVLMTLVLQDAWQRVMTYLESEFKKTCPAPKPDCLIKIVQPSECGHRSTITTSASGSWDCGRP